MIKGDFELNYDERLSLFVTKYNNENNSIILTVSINQEECAFCS